MRLMASMSNPPPEPILGITGGLAQYIDLDYYWVSQYFTPTVNLTLEALQLKFIHIRPFEADYSCLVRIIKDNIAIGEATKSFSLSPNIEGSSQSSLVEFGFPNSFLLEAGTQYRLVVYNLSDMSPEFAIEGRVHGSPVAPPGQPDVFVGLNVVLGECTMHRLNSVVPFVGVLYFLGYGTFEQAALEVGFSAGVGVQATFTRQVSGIRSLTSGFFCVGVGFSCGCVRLRGFIAGLTSRAGFSRFFLGARNWAAETVLGAGLSRLFCSFRQFYGGLNARAVLSRVISYLRSWTTKTVLHSTFIRQVGALRQIPANLWAGAGLSQFYGVVYGFAANFSLSSTFELFRVSALRVAAFNAGVSVKASLHRQVTITRQILTKLVVLAGLRGVFLGVRCWLAKTAVFSGVERGIIIVRKFSAKLGMPAGFGRVFSVLRGFGANLWVSVWFSRGFLYVRALAAQMHLGFVFEQVFGRLRGWLWLLERRHKKYPDIVEEIL